MPGMPAPRGFETVAVALSDPSTACERIIETRAGRLVASQVKSHVLAEAAARGVECSVERRGRLAAVKFVFSLSGECGAVNEVAGYVAYLTAVTDALRNA